MSDDVALIQSTALVVKTGASMALGSEISFNTGIDFAGRGKSKGSDSIDLKEE